MLCTCENTGYCDCDAVDRLRKENSVLMEELIRCLQDFKDLDPVRHNQLRDVLDRLSIKGG